MLQHIKQTKRLLTLLLSIAILMPLNSYAQQQAVIKESEKSAFKGALYSVWNRLRALNPRTNAAKATGHQVVATAGIRGSQETETLFAPYWKGDKTNDKQFLAEVDAIIDAQNLADKGALPEAEKAYSKFISQYPESELLPNAVFAKALTQGVSGKKQIAINGMKKFIKQNPNHPLVTDAELVVSTLSKQ